MSGPVHILIVDDDDSSRYMLQVLLAGTGYDVAVARGGTQALALAQSRPPALVVSDILMPEMDGFSLCRAWQADPGLRHIPFVFYTATYTDPRDERFALSLGATDFIIKPTDPDVLLARVRTALDRGPGTAAARPLLDEERRFLEDHNASLMRKLNEKIAQLAQVNSELDNRMRALVHANEDLERFADMAAHDLQEPIRTLVSYSQLLERRFGTELGAEGGEFLAYIINAAMHLKGLLAQLQVYSDTMTSDHPQGWVNMAEVMDHALVALDQRIRQCGARVEWDRESMPTVWGQEAQLTLLLENIIDNSLNYACPDMPPRIRIKVMPRDGAWAFAVEDNGIGIEKPYWNHVFLAFKRLHNAQSRPGSGLGLTLCERIIERHHGAIKVMASIPGQGTVMGFTLPKDRMGTRHDP